MALKKSVDFFGKKEKPKNFKSGLKAGKNAEKAKYQFSKKPAVCTESKIYEMQWCTLEHEKEYWEIEKRWDVTYKSARVHFHTEHAAGDHAHAVGAKEAGRHILNDHGSMSHPERPFNRFFAGFEITSVMIDTIMFKFTKHISFTKENGIVVAIKESRLSVL